MTWDAMVLLVVIVGVLLVARWRGRIIGANSVDAFGDRVDQYFERREKARQSRPKA
jgi:hypothetical protein